MSIVQRVANGANDTFAQCGRVALLLCMGGGLVWFPRPAIAQNGIMGGSVNCTAVVTNSAVPPSVDPTLAFGSSTSGVDLINNINTNDSTAIIHYTCTSSALVSTVNVRMCLHIDGGQGSPAQMNPRQMAYTPSPPTASLMFNLYRPDNQIWTTNSTMYGTSTAYLAPMMTLAPGESQSYSVTMRAALAAGQLTAIPNTGSTVYRRDFTAGSTAVGWNAVRDFNGDPGGCGSSMSKNRFPFTVLAFVVPACKVGVAGNIDFLEQLATATNLWGSTSFNVTCTHTTPYYIGLQPQHAGSSNAGAGVMRPADASNTDAVPYQLYRPTGAGSGAPRSGNVWGNTATSTTVGNGMGGTGAGGGISTTYMVYANVPNADFKPDLYEDKVIINVNY